ncbi:hypothetical protein JHK82_014542 [Glycine max]|uniref:BZIP domain-containing protein n=2 Tax=Glycine subgen. Soja TaxID=1462606 RepID=I1K8R4_SOYBN|nr:uncharacterized protein LOC100785860 [Glycine max]XP_028235206.1 uncharacterized protein LOC114414949 [Glycine soja]KAG5018599.1 hypothetical protein JHK87_014454 [Glycine soja]KAG5045158.1 hypothetical protein JHK86_014564 [Glycine max]KAG5147661.1 hypothetical protein JHK82_014542 [Glycine max]KRH52383.1 hypothetical protein GLYMA_06G065100v4 [Glycine max]RZC06101.1 hypothetical protein D0Y65_013923 [Glycine soja]|eukprot:XP_003527783.1 uncharacterized protein LOC100785860 [Glycine max]
MVNDDEWVRAAMEDDTVVVELLLRLKQGTVLHKSHHQQLLPFSWGVKQPRSRSRLTSAAVSRCDAAVSTRCSPTTPLSWSAGADSYEDSSRHHHHHAAVSKATATSGYTGNSASTKRCRRKKTFAELKEEESSLLKESIYLKKEIASVNANFEAQRAKNESLKRMKLDVGSKYQNNPSSTSVEPQRLPAGQPHQRIVVSTEALIRPIQEDTHSLASESRPNRIKSTGESFFLIPDLNMVPSEDVSCTDALCGMS